MLTKGMYDLLVVFYSTLGNYTFATLIKDGFSKTNKTATQVAVFAFYQAFIEKILYTKMSR